MSLFNFCSEWKNTFIFLWLCEILNIVCSFPSIRWPSSPPFCLWTFVEWSYLTFIASLCSRLCRMTPVTQQRSYSLWSHVPLCQPQPPGLPTVFHLPTHYPALHHRRTLVGGHRLLHLKPHTQNLLTVHLTGPSMKCRGGSSSFISWLNSGLFKSLSW